MTSKLWILFRTHLETILTWNGWNKSPPYKILMCYLFQVRKQPFLLETILIITCKVLVWLDIEICKGQVPCAFHNDWCHLSHFHLLFKVMDKCPERAKGLHHQDAFLNERDKPAEFLFLTRSESKGSIMIGFSASSQAVWLTS